MGPIQEACLDKVTSERKSGVVMCESVNKTSQYEFLHQTLLHCLASETH
jgi:hypothetical protein